MVKFKNLWLFERSKFQIFLNFIIAQYMAGIKTRPNLTQIYELAYKNNFSLVLPAVRKYK